MAEPATTAPLTAVGHERDALLATKLHLPRPRPGLVARPRLLARLNEGVGQELVLVCTPAGFGKTTLLAEWVRAGQRPVAWLSLDEADNDPARFWRHVAAALEPVRPGVAERVTALLGSPPASFEGPVTALVNELAELSDDVVLVLDDYHLIQAPAVHVSVEFLLQHLPPSLRLVLASRADPPLSLAGLRGRGQLAELRQTDLRFTPQEAGELLGATVGAELPEVAVAALGNRTEGWAAGLQLAALSLQGRSDIGEFVEGFSGSHRYVLDYLTEEVLDRQPPQLRTFLLESSVLERLCSPLCEAVTGRNDSQQLLEQVERANLFLVPLDDVRGWWRYHHLFADLLRGRLQQQWPERVPELHRAAADWCERHGLVDDAIRHARAAGDLPWAARLVEQHFEAVLGRREDATLRRWLELLPAEVVRSRPRLCLLQAFWALIGSRVEAVERLLDDAERAFSYAGEEPYQPAVGRAASLVANIRAAIARLRAGAAHLRGDAEQTITLARRALAELDEGEWMLESVTRWQLVGAEWLRGRPAEAERGFLSALASLAAWRTTGQLTLVAWGYDHLGHAQRARGHLGAALATYQEALEAVAGDPGQPVMPAAVREAEQVPLSGAVVGLLNPSPAVRARLELANGQVKAAARWVQQRGFAVQDEPGYPRERDYLVLARVLLAQHAPERALELLEPWTALAASQGRTESTIELLALQALAHADRGDEPAALTTLAEALVLGAPEGYLRVFVDEGLPMAALFRRLLGGRHPEWQAAVDAVPRDYLARLAVAFEQAGAPVFPAAKRGAVLVPGLVEALSARELEVLALLATGKSNRAIAEDLVVTLDTVKRHVTNLFNKLGVANRVQAVARARELGLLS
ncbi:MAG TPA: LuxR C-terminal-related transcriptional regulator [Actinomycetota bacterium]|nr:LuxR C-terminal-related transcriptional regulator [Actinomycetota bacterium]